jgi:hypothetical protein
VYSPFLSQDALKKDELPNSESGKPAGIPVEKNADIHGRRLLEACKSYMGRKEALFLSDSAAGNGGDDLVNQTVKLRLRFQSYPQNSGTPLIGKATGTAEVKMKLPGRN